MRSFFNGRARRRAALVFLSLAALVITGGTSEQKGHMASASATAQAVVAPSINWQQTYGPSPDPSVKAVAYAPDGGSVATAHGDRAVNLRRAGDGALLRSITNPGYSCGGGATGIAYSPDSQLVAAADACATRLLATATGALVRKLGAAGRIAYSPDGAYLASTTQTSYRDRTVKLWRVSDGTLLWSATGGGNQIAFAPDGTLATVNRDGIEFWNVATGAKLRTFAGPVTAIAFSPDSQLVAAAGAPGGEYPYDATISIFRVGDGSLVRQLTRTGDVWTMRFTPDGNYLTSGGQDVNYERGSGYVASTNTIRLWRLSDGLAFKTYDLGTDSPGFGGLAVAPDGQTFAYAVGANTYLAQSPAQTQCTYSITPTSANFERDGGDATVTVNTQSGCQWTARARVSWTSITANATGTGPGTVTYNVAPDTEQVSGGNPYLIHAVIVVADQTFAIHQNITPSGPSYYKIYGQISDGSCLNGISGVTVTLGGSSSATTTTDANGNYSFTNLLGGQSYTVTPSKSGYVFNPSSSTISSLNSDTTAYFTATTNPNPLPSIRGRVADAGGVGQADIQVQLTGGLYPRTAYTISNGNYAFTCLESGYNYTVTPTSSTNSFTPSARTFSNLTTAQTGADFVAGPLMITISGHVTAAGQPLADALVKFADDGRISTATTDNAGYYAHTVAASGYHDVTPSKDGYVFTPQVANFLDPPTNQTADFAGSPATAAIEGWVKTNDDHAIAGATVQLSGASSATTQTDANGYFIFDNLAPFKDYNVAAAMPGETFRPASRTFSYVAGKVGYIFYGTADLTDGLCVAGLSPASAEFPSGGGALVTQINAPAGCDWTAHSDADWIVVSRGNDNGTGAHSFSAQVLTNYGATARDATVTIGGRTLAVSQLAASAPDIAWLGGGGAGGGGSADISPDSQLLATPSDGTVKLWRYADGQLLRTIGSFSTNINAVKFSPDGRSLALVGQWLPGASDYSATIKLYRVADGALLRQFNTGAIYDARSVAFSPDGATLYVATSLECVEVRRVSDGALLRRLGPFNARAVALSPDGQLVAAAGDDYWSEIPSVRVWRTSDGAAVQTFTNLNLISNSIAFSPDGRTLAAGDWGGSYSQGGAVYLWRTSDWSLAHTLQEPKYASVSVVAFSPDGHFVASGGTDAFCTTCLNDIYVWSTDTGALVNTFPANIGTIFSINFFDPTTLVSRGGEPLARVFHVPDGTAARTIGAQRVFTTSVAFSPDGTLFAANGADDANGDLFGAGLYASATGAHVRDVIGHQDIVNAVAFSPDGRTLATASGSEPPDTRDTRIMLWSPATGSHVLDLAGHAGGTLSVAFSPGGNFLASGGRDNQIKIWSPSLGTLVTTLTGHTGYVNQVAFSPDGSLLASASGDATVKLWRTSDWSLVRTIGGTGYPVNSVAFSPDGQRLAAAFGNYGNNLQLYRVADGALLRTFAGDYSSGMGQVTFSHDGTTILSTSRGYPPAIWFWDATDGHLVRVYEQETGRRYAPALALSSDGTLLGIGRYDQTLEVAHYPSPAVSCAPTLTPQSQDATASGGTFTISVGTNSACAWTATSNDPAWLTVLTGSQGVGSGQVTYAVAPNAATAQRTGSLTVAGRTFTVTQAAPASGPVYSVSGHVTDALGNAMPGVAVSLSGAATGTRTTDSDGNYSFARLAGGASYTLAASLAGYTFTPASQSVNNLGGDAVVSFAVAANVPAPVLISEFRLSGPRGASDEYVELYNSTNEPITVATTDGSLGWTLASLDTAGNSPSIFCTIPAGAIIPPHGHYLAGNVDAALSGALAPASAFDVTYAGDVGDDRGIALFRTAAPEHLTLGYRIDAVSFTTQTPAAAAQLFAKGSPLAPVAESIEADEQYAYVRRFTSAGPQDTGDSSQDFVLVSTAGTVGGQPVQLGSPAPEGSGGLVQVNSQMKASALERFASVSDAPNRVRDTTPVPNGAQGTLVIRRRFTNRTGEAVTRLRFRIVDITTLNTPGADGGQADLRAIDSADVQVTTPSGGLLLVRGTTVDRSLPQNAGGGLNSALVVTLPDGGLAAGDSVNVQFTLGVQTTGNYRFLVNVEALTGPQTGTTQLRTQKSGQTFK